MQQTISRWDDPEGAEMRTYSAALETAYLPSITDWIAFRHKPPRTMEYCLP